MDFLNSFNNDMMPFTFMCLTSFFTLTNPFGTMPLFLTMTQGLDNDRRRQIVKKATITSFIILVAFTVCGQILFKFFGISANGFRIAAGIIILKIGFDMLQAKYSSVKLRDDEVSAYAENISITPLAIPMLCGPGAIANGMVLMDQASGSWPMKFILIGSIAIIYFIAYIVLTASVRLTRILGETGNNVMMRLMGLIIMVIAVEIFVAGAKPIIVDMIQAGIH